MICPTCINEVGSIRTILKHGELTTGCEHCLNDKSTHGQNDAAKYNRDRQREDYRQDIVQPMEGRDYIKARGIDRAREVGFSDNDIRQLY